MSTIKPLAFISHRRQDKDSQIAARFIKNELDEVFGEEHIFLDVDGVSVGDVWPQQLKDKLAQATVLVIIISEEWIKMSDKYGRRLLDQENDWVRHEIETSLQRNIKILPVLVRAEMPPKEALPEALQAIRNFQYFKLRVNDWKNDIEDLTNFLKGASFVIANRLDIPMPKIPRDKHYPLPYNIDELKTELANLPGWEIIKLDDGIGIEKKYIFKKFKKAVEYMFGLTDYVQRMEHHPIWENTWRTVIVKFSTWDIGNKVTVWDTEMARYFDKFFEDGFA